MALDFWLRAPAWSGLLVSLFLSATILAVDLVTGPLIRVSILQVFPVAIATTSGGLPPGIAFALGLPVVRFALYLQWTASSGVAMAIADSLVDVAILVALAFLVAQIARQAREIKLLEGILPICSFCKRIRNDAGTWEPLERYISTRSAAAFSHSICIDCGETHYPGLINKPPPRNE